ncbi:MAG: tryptophan--tRNA ligase [Deltaproteobacteria bacterium]|nr:tryptophan--tRNA ligase [Deltaproteobacteria bacterium]
MNENTVKQTLLSAVKPTNIPTIGNYLGAIKNWVKMQNDYDCIFFAVDLHAITAKQEPQKLRERTLYVLASYVACGIDPNKTLIFVQSHVPEHTELAWILTCYSSMGELSRMTQYKDKVQKEGQNKEKENIQAGMFCYPLLMAADILLYQTNLVPVGEDQKQHIEITRDIAERLNNIYGKDLFTVPRALMPKVGARIMSLQNPSVKMSKSDDDPNGTVSLNDSNDEIIRKVKRAVTDSGNEITDDPSKPGVKNLLQIQSAILSKPIYALVQEYAGKQYGQLKSDTAELLVQSIEPIREKTNEILKNTTYLTALLKDGAEKARNRARKTIKRVHERIGFIAFSE